MKKNLGSISLLVAFSRPGLFEALLRLRHSFPSGWKIVTAGFEAATIGGFADWFGSALFHEIQFPLSASIQTLSPK
jgi:uncharacterized membrane-anchored protein YjiN (DUF445 family)